MPDVPAPEAPEEEPAHHERPRIDVSPALGEAGHEVEELGYEGIPDEGPLLQNAGDPHAERDLNDAVDGAALPYPLD